MRSSLLAPLALGLLAAAARPAAADDNVAKADALFAEGIRLRDSNLEAACAKFTQSLDLNPQAIGVLLNVALCDEKHGRIASAVRRYREARQRAIEQDFPEHKLVTEQKLSELEPSVPYLSIRFVQPPAPQTKVVVDDRVIPMDQLERVPLDPGERLLTVSAPGRVTFQRRVTIQVRRLHELEVPALAKAVVSARRSVGKLTVAGGGAALVTGVVLGFIANRRYDEQFKGSAPRCETRDDGPPLCEPAGQSAVESARLLGNVGTIVGSVGVAALVVGGYLWYTGPQPTRTERRIAVSPHVGPASAGLTVIGRF